LRGGSILILGDIRINTSAREGKQPSSGKNFEQVFLRTRTSQEKKMYNRRSICLSDSESENSESCVSKDSDRELSTDSSRRSEKRDSLPRTIRRKNSKVLTPEVLDLCAKEIQQESMFKKRYEQAAMFVYGTNPEHCGIESAALSSQPDGNVFKMPYLSDPCFTSFGYFR